MEEYKDYTQEIRKLYNRCWEILNDENKSEDEIKQYNKDLREGSKLLCKESRQWRNEVETRLKKLKKGTATPEDIEYLRQVFSSNK